jgi:hypothetical protein
MTTRHIRQTGEGPSGPLAYTVEGAVRASGFTRTRIYAYMNDGQLSSFKAGRRRMIRAESLRALIDAMSTTVA